MLNELNKNHMGGLENYGAEDLYNLEDTWDERRQENVKPKVKVSFSLCYNEHVRTLSLLALLNVRPW